ncbi:uncharacterized protein FOMMEDRAFT_143194 [Fomitiporia mediterranea MF3/22]|uniref:uncharacterized protein n=1 Tax=Fomitiporia mediterranea (strain MF3/22) TaxID=694068 RepID=UPI00044095CD|nr:uncharacterized protein FOMMEDRAFT_143194 [Fomitiporia mediterranea MF3/22]EJC98381.1 hypothetical protein FOMMEDRAFT_143194 [Fomitiporia mediterranea MF3/22]
MPEVKSFPIFYPPDGLYYIFSKDYGHFWRQRGTDWEGAIIDCEPLGQVREGNTMDNRIWKVTTTRPATNKLGPRVTLQSALAPQESESEDAVGFVSKKSGKVIPSNKKASWTLIGHGMKPFAYKIVTNDLRISINAPMHSAMDPKSELHAEFHVTSAYDMRVYDPQWWYFIPVGQIDGFLSANGIQRAGK